MIKASAELYTLACSFDPFTLVDIGLFALAVVLTITGACRLWRVWRGSRHAATAVAASGSADPYLLMLSVIANISPLIGLLGTLVGLGVAFTASAEHSLVDLLSGAAVAINSSVAGVFAAVTAAIGQAGLRWLEDHLERQRVDAGKLPTRSPDEDCPIHGQQEKTALGTLRVIDGQGNLERKDSHYEDSPL